MESEVEQLFSINDASRHQQHAKSDISKSVASKPVTSKSVISNPDANKSAANKSNVGQHKLHTVNKQAMPDSQQVSASQQVVMPHVVATD